MNLVLGFEDHAYSERFESTSPIPKSKRRRPVNLKRSQFRYGRGKTSSQVAEELEQRYGIVEAFYEINEDEISGMIENAVGESVDVIIETGGEGRPEDAARLPEKELRRIERMFKSALSDQAFDGVISGVPTRAALLGVSHNYQHPFAKRGSRPSFIDTGLYQASFSAWMED